MAIKTEAVSVVTYNCLAKEYIGHNKGLSPKQSSYGSQSRVDDLVARVLKTHSDIVCLQEVSADDFQSFAAKMAQQGYRGSYEKFDHKHDGVAIFYKQQFQQVGAPETISYNDGTGRKALGLHLKINGALFDVWNTHFQGGQQNIPVANAQIQALGQKINKAAHPQIVCMDANFTPQDLKFQAMTQFNLKDSIAGQQSPTSMNGSTALRLDYIFHSRSLLCRTSHVAGNLNSYLTQQEPSDHIPITAVFEVDVPAMQNPFPGGSFKEKIFSQFLGEKQFEGYADAFAQMLSKADTGGDFADNIYHQIQSVQDPHARTFLVNVCAKLIKFTTVIAVRCDVGLGNKLTLRGSGPGMSWDKGVDMTWQGGNWIYAMQGNFQNFEYKILRNDKDWEQGANRMGQLGQKGEIVPKF